MLGETVPLVRSPQGVVWASPYWHVFFFVLRIEYIYIEVVEERSIDRAYCTDSSRHPEILCNSL